MAVTGANESSQIGGSPRSVQLHDLMELTKRYEMAARIRDARERAGLTQPEAADLVGTSFRNYQRYEKSGITKREVVENIAKAFRTSADYLWDGSSQNGIPAGTQLDRIEAKVDQLLDGLEALGAVRVAEDAAERAKPQSGRRSGRARGASSRRATTG